MEQEEYTKEEIDWSYIEFVDNQDVLDLIEKVWFSLRSFCHFRKVLSVYHLILVLSVFFIYISMIKCNNMCHCCVDVGHHHVSNTRHVFNMNFQCYIDYHLLKLIVTLSNTLSYSEALFSQNSDSNKYF